MAAALAATMLMAGGCGASTDTIAQATTEEIMMADTDAFYSNSKSADAGGGESDTVAATSASVETNRKLIKTVNLSVETETYDAFLSSLNEKLAAIGGYTEYFSTSGNDGSRYGSMTIRVPKDKLDDFLDTVEGASNITYRQENVEDVTLDYVDVESRKKMLETEQERLLELLEEADSLEDILTIESRLTEVQYELESKESQLRIYDNQIDYSTVYLDIEEVTRYTPQEQTGVWDKISTGFMENLYDVGTGLRDFLIAVVIHIPNIIVFLIFIGILALIIKAVSKRHAVKQKKKRQKQEIENTKQEGNEDAGK